MSSVRQWLSDVRLVQFAVIVAVLSLMAGCATPYQAKGAAGGFSETQLAMDVYRIHFGGNAYTSPEQVQDFALLRAADLTLEHNFKYFAIMDETASNEVSAFTTPGTANTTGSGYVYGNTGYAQGNFSSQTTYTPPQTYLMYKPRSDLAIRCCPGPLKCPKFEE